MNRLAEPKNNFFGRGQFSWYYPHRTFQKSLQILPSPTVSSFGRREHFFIIQCSLFGSWGLSTCCFQHLPFKGRRKTDGHKKTFQRQSTQCKTTHHTLQNRMKKKTKTRKKAGGCRGRERRLKASCRSVQTLTRSEVPLTQRRDSRLEEQVVWRPNL